MREGGSVDWGCNLGRTSSMKMMAGCFSLARAKASRTILAPSPMNICTSCGPASFKNVALVCAAHARAMRVLPVPGGPYRRTPLGGRTPSLMKRSWGGGGRGGFGVMSVVGVGLME